MAPLAQLPWTLLAGHKWLPLLLQALLALALAQQALLGSSLLGALRAPLQTGPCACGM